MIRPLNPLDLAALVSFAGSVLNEAAPRERLAVSQSLGSWTGEVVRHWLAPRDKRVSLACQEGWRMVGLASMRELAGRGAWEVDGLFLRPSDEQGCSELLNASCSAVGRRKGERLFLRLHSASSWIPTARDAGFTRYLSETLYQMPASLRTATTSSETPPLRRRVPGDDHALFRLYSAATPEGARSAQGLTLELWRGGQERRHCRELVYEVDGQLLGWLRVSRFRDTGCFDMLVDPLAKGDVLRHLMAHGLRLLQGKPRVFCLVAEHQSGLRDLVREMVCTEVFAYDALVRHLAVRERESSLMPSHA